MQVLLEEEGSRARVAEPRVRRGRGQEPLPSVTEAPQQALVILLVLAVLLLQPLGQDRRLIAPVRHSSLSLSQFSGYCITDSLLLKFHSRKISRMGVIDIRVSNLGEGGKEAAQVSGDRFGSVYVGRCNDGRGSSRSALPRLLHAGVEFDGKVVVSSEAEGVATLPSPLLESSLCAF